MINTLRRRYGMSGRLPWPLIAVVILLAAAYLGQHASVWWLLLILVVMVLLILLKKPVLGLLLTIPFALLLPVQINTGTEVKLTAVSLYIPFLFGVWLLDMIRQRAIRLTPSRTNLPLLLFLLAGLVSLVIGNATWDPQVPRGGNFLLVQLAQWAIFAFSAIAFWLTGNLVKDVVMLRRLTWAFLGVAGALALATAMVSASSVVDSIATVALIRAPFWVLLTGLSMGQLLFNPRLSWSQRLFMAALLVAVFIYSFIQQRESLSNWIGVTVVIGTLLWLRFPRLRWLAIIAVVAMILLGSLLPAIYDFAGGDNEWYESGGSRLVLIERVVEITMRNPITGLGPAAYRPYAATEPLAYGRIIWAAPMINSHNNFIDLFSHVGFVGLGLFLWFAVEVVRNALCLRGMLKTGFQAAFVNGMLASWIGALVIMLLADWILPFVYNIGFEGFPASILLWLFLGGIVALEQLPPEISGEVKG